jgi:hypothetical protein
MMLDKADSDDFLPNCPWNRGAATVCPLHPQIEMIEHSGYDEDGDYFFHTCESCERELLGTEEELDEKS